MIRKDDQQWDHEYSALRKRIFDYGVTEDKPPAEYRDHSDGIEAAGGGTRRMLVAGEAGQ